MSKIQKNKYIYDDIHNDKIRFDTICKNYEYLPTILPAVKRIIAIGDIHGDIELALNFLKVGKLIEEIDFKRYSENINLSFRVPILKNNNDFKFIYPTLSTIFNGTNNDYILTDLQFRYFLWIGNDTTVVQVGDQIDRCRPLHNLRCNNQYATYEDENSDLLIMEMFDNLHKIARKCGGAVYSLIGNHEVMNFEGNFDYVSYKGTTDYINLNDKINDRKQDFDRLREKFACTRNAIIIIGDFAFVHGGLVSTLLTKYNVSEINNVIRMYIFDKFKSLRESHKNDHKKFKEIYKDYKKIINSTSISPLWYRKLAQIMPDNFTNNNNNNLIKQQNDCKELMDPVIDHFINYGIKLQGLTIGHTPQFGVHNLGINTACNGKIIRVDIGASKAFDNLLGNGNDDFKNQRQPQVAEILNNDGKYTINILK